MSECEGKRKEGKGVIRKKLHMSKRERERERL